MRFSTGRAVRTTRLALTPMIDVVFLLITFFMVVSEISRQDQIEIRPPQTHKNEALEPRCLIITILHDGTTYVGGQQVGVAELESILVVERRLAPTLRVLIRADRRTHFRHIRAILDICTKRHVAIPNVAFFTHPAEA